MDLREWGTRARLSHRAGKVEYGFIFPVTSYDDDDGGAGIWGQKAGIPSLNRDIKSRQIALSLPLPLFPGSSMPNGSIQNPG